MSWTEVTLVAVAAIWTTAIWINVVVLVVARSKHKRFVMRHELNAESMRRSVALERDKLEHWKLHTEASLDPGQRQQLAKLKKRADKPSDGSASITGLQIFPGGGGMTQVTEEEDRDR